MSLKRYFYIRDTHMLLREEDGSEIPVGSYEGAINYLRDLPNLKDMAAPSPAVAARQRRTRIVVSLPADPDAKSSRPRMWKYYSGQQNVLSAIDYVRELDRRLHRVDRFEFGELVEVKFYADVARAETGKPILDYRGRPTVREDDLVIRETHMYYRQPGTDFAIRRDIQIEWINEDGTTHSEVKTRSKMYSDFQQIQESKRRRGNVIDILQVDTGFLIIATEVSVPQSDPAYPIQVEQAYNLGRAWMEGAKDHILTFVDAANPTLIQYIMDSTDSFMDNDLARVGLPGVTIRHSMLNALSKWNYLLGL